MGAKSNIEWTDATWNPIAGCSIKSAGCTNCYAQQLAGTRLAEHPMYAGTTSMTKAGPVFNGVLKEAADDHDVWTFPFRWQGPSEPRRGAGARPMCFVGDMSDLFHENRLLGVIDDVVVRAIIADHIDFQFLTKRPEVMHRYFTDDYLPVRLSAAAGELLDGDWIWKAGKRWRKRIEHVVEALLEDSDAILPAHNIWLGTSTEDQRTADERIGILLEIPAAVHFISAEPLLGEIDLTQIPIPSAVGRAGAKKAVLDTTLAEWDAYREGSVEIVPTFNALKPNMDGLKGLDQVIVGGESGDKARQSVIGYQRSVIQQALAAGVAAFEKQLGYRPVNREGERHAITDRKGGNLGEMPEDLRVRQWPAKRDA